MFRQASRSLRPHLRSLHTRSAGARGNGVAITTGSAALLGCAVLWYSTRAVHNDATIAPESKRVSAVGVAKPKPEPDTLSTLVWGSNRCSHSCSRNAIHSHIYSDHELSPASSDSGVIRTPTNATWLDNIALRDLQLHEKHAACVDARGDVYQWGDGFFGKASSGTPSAKLTLRGKVCQKSTHAEPEK